MARTAAPAPVVTWPIAASAPPGDPPRDYSFFASALYPFFASTLDLAKAGHVEQEFFLQGTASRYGSPPAQTGSVIDGGHPHKTCIMVRRPASASHFNGKVVVEWLNVTNGMDQEQTWCEIDRHLLSAGYAWVGDAAESA
jgi:alpha/beta hydrolase family protein